MRGAENKGVLNLRNEKMAGSTALQTVKNVSQVTLINGNTEDGAGNNVPFYTTIQFPEGIDAAEVHSIQTSLWTQGADDDLRFIGLVDFTPGAVTVSGGSSATGYKICAVTRPFDSLAGVSATGTPQCIYHRWESVTAWDSSAIVALPNAISTVRRTEEVDLGGVDPQVVVGNLLMGIQGVALAEGDSDTIELHTTVIYKKKTLSAKALLEISQMQE